MTGSRVRRLACALALFAAPAMAQWTSDKPPVLGPDDYPPIADDENQPPANASPRNLQGQQPPQGATGAPQQLPGDQVPAALPPVGPAVEVGSLGSPEGPPVGTLDASNGGLGGDIWSGSERTTVEDLLKRAPLASADPAFRHAVERIVLTKAAAPPGPAKRAFVTMRIEKMLDAGLIDQAGAMAAQASVPNDEDFARVQANALLIDNRAADVCGDDTATRLNAGDVFWMQLRAYCAAEGGDQATADLTNAVLRAQGSDDPAYDALVDDVLNHKTTLPAVFAHPTALHVFLLQQAGFPIPDAVARSMGTSVNLLAMRDGRNPAPSRFAAAERIVRTGAAPVSDLKVIADAQDLPLSRVANAALDAPNMPFFKGQVLLRRAAVIEPRPEEKARLAAEALTLGEKAGLFPLAAALQSDIVDKLKPPFAGDQRLFARALLLAGRPDAAARFTVGDPVMRSIAGLVSRDPGRLAAAQADLSAFAVGLTKNPPDPDADRSYKALVLGIADVLGLPMPPDAKAQAASLEARSWDGRRPDPGDMRAIEEVSMTPDRRGEALLMILDTANGIGLDALAPDVTIELVRLLGSMNEPQTARALAIDALAQYVPPPPPVPTASAQ